MAAQGFLKTFLDVMGMTATENDPPKQVAQVVRLTSNDTYTLPAHIREVKIISGKAWASYGTHDVVLAWGQRMAFPAHDTIILTSLGSRPVMIELIL